MSQKTEARGRRTVYKIRLQKGDTVVVRSGKYKGRTGKVLATHPKLNKASVEGLNIVKRHLKPTRTQPQGGIVEEIRPIWVSKLAVMDGAQKATKISYKLDKADAKVRIAKTSGKEL